MLNVKRQLNHHDRAPVVFGVGIVLLCMFIFSLNMTGGLYARYTTTVSGEASARIAQFNPSLVIDGSETELSTIVAVPFTPDEAYALTIINQSEVAVQYHLLITNMTNNLPIADVQTSLNQPIAPGGEQTVTLGINWSMGDQEKLNPNLSGMVDLLQVTLQIVQVD